MNKRLIIDIQPLIKTKKLLEKALKEGVFSELEEMGGVQAFEMAYELSWKTMKKVLGGKGVEVYSPKETFRKAVAEGIIENFENWGITYLETRNLTVYSYDVDILADVWKVLPNFLKDLTKFIKNLDKHINLVDNYS